MASSSPNIQLLNNRRIRKTPISPSIRTQLQGIEATSRCLSRTTSPCNQADSVQSSTIILRQRLLKVSWESVHPPLSSIRVRESKPIWRSGVGCSSNILSLPTLTIRERFRKQLKILPEVSKSSIPSLEIKQAIIETDNCQSLSARGITLDKTSRRN